MSLKMGRKSGSKNIYNPKDLERLKFLGRKLKKRRKQVKKTQTEIGKAIGTIGGATIKQKETGIIGLFQGFEPQQLESAKRPELIESTEKGE